MTPRDDAILRRIVIEELSEARARKLAGFLRTYRNRLVKRYDALKDRSGIKASTMRAMLRDANYMQRQLHRQLHDEFREGAKDFAKDQADWRAANLQSAAIEADITGLTSRQAIAAMDFNPAVGRHASEWFKELDTNHRRRVASAIRQSFAEGESVFNATQRLKEVVDMNARGLRTFVRTSYSNIAANVDLATYKANQIEKYVWLSTLDSRTTPICINRDGNEYVTGSGPLPPAHMNCRSTTYALTPETKDARNETYDQWLRRQASENPKTVYEVLGRNRGQQYIDNPGLSVKKFISRNGGWKKLDDIKPPKPKARAKRAGSAIERETWSDTPAMQEAAVRMLKGIPAWAEKLILSLPVRKINVVKSGAWYNSRSKTVSSSLKDEGAIRHEFGHAVDNQLGKGKREYESFSPEYRDAFKKDRKAIYALEKDPDTELPVADKLAEAFGVKLERRRYNTNSLVYLWREVEAKYGQGVKTQEVTNFADFLGAISDNRMGYGHTNAYYKKWRREAGFSSANTTEAFANWFHFMTGDNASLWDEIFEAYAPQVHAAFKEMTGIA